MQNKFKGFYTYNVFFKFKITPKSKIFKSLQEAVKGKKKPWEIAVEEANKSLLLEK